MAPGLLKEGLEGSHLYHGGFMKNHGFRAEKLDIHSLKFRLWAYFALFTLLLLFTIWLLQIFFLNNYYQKMKIEETQAVAQSIIVKAQGSTESILEEVREMSLKNDMYIHIEATSNTIIFSPLTEEGRRPSYAYVEEMATLKEQLTQSGETSTSIIIPEARTNTNTLAYACYLETDANEQVIIYIFSPLYPVSSTVDILQRQLIYITAIALIIAIILTGYMTNRISKPLKQINTRAKELAQGNYGIVFEGGDYSELVELASTLTHTSIALEKTSNLQKDLIANVSHDLRTPLTMVKSYAEMISDISGDDPAKRASHLQVIIEEADRLGNLVNDMLSLSKIQSGVMTIEKSNFNLRETLETILHAYLLLDKNSSYNIKFTCPSQVQVFADETKIKQVFSNLMNNAMKYCGAEKKIQITVTTSFGAGQQIKARCEVKDDGKGIEPEELDHIWERYYKTSTNHARPTAGTGLGLSIVKEILVLHGASFGVESAPGKGSTFWFELPSEG